MLKARLRYKAPEGGESKLIEREFEDQGAPFAEADQDLKFAASVASFAMLLRGSKYAGDADFDKILAWSAEGLGADLRGVRAEFRSLVSKAKLRSVR